MGSKNFGQSGCTDNWLQLQVNELVAVCVPTLSKGTWQTFTVVAVQNLGWKWVLKTSADVAVQILSCNCSLIYWLQYVYQLWTMVVGKPWLQWLCKTLARNGLYTAQLEMGSKNLSRCGCANTSLQLQFNTLIAVCLPTLNHDSWRTLATVAV
jgi:hypothetical protein